MIERKQYNDAVRRREFDKLRRLRLNPMPSTGNATAALSDFQDSWGYSVFEERANTLKKIDEIEAQMSKQWWKAHDGVAASAQEVHEPQGLDSAFATTMPSDLADSTLEVPTRLADATQSRESGPLSVPYRDARDTTQVLTDAFAVSSLEYPHEGSGSTDPVLEEAAIRFANGDDAGAYAGLLEALRSQRAEPVVAWSWVAALLDWCRATENRGQFDQLVQEFSAVLDGARPAWLSLSDLPGVTDSPSQAVSALPLLWESPPQLTIAAMEALREVLGNNPMPWHLGWSQVMEVAPDAMPLLGGLFSSLCNEPVVIQMTGADRLVQAVQARTPSGNRSVDPTWWAVRLDVLRALHLQDAFEMVALDYCVTYEDVPPSWQDAQCTLQGAVTQIADAPSVDAAPVHKLVLRGQVTGDASQALAVFEGQAHVKGRIVVDCYGLLRVDFPAAGSILNWVAARQAAGCSVQFRDVHRLVAAFFNVIGINEHAQVVPRAM